MAKRRSVRTLGRLGTFAGGVLLAVLPAGCGGGPPGPAPSAGAPGAPTSAGSAASSAAADTVPLPTYEEDSFRWLEAIEGERAMEWVRRENRETERELASTPLFDSLYHETLAALDAPSRIPSPTWRGPWLYDLRQDAEHPRGVYRRTTLEELAAGGAGAVDDGGAVNASRTTDGAAADAAGGAAAGSTSWETVLDMDSLSAAEGEPWAFDGMSCLPPEHRRCLVFLSPGGTDAVQVREFDADRLEFVEDGFFLPVAKSSVAWRDADHVYVATDYGPGSLTASGYPRIVKLWERGTPLEQAPTLHRGDSASVSVQATRLRTDRGDVDLLSEGVSFYRSERYQVVDGEPVRLDLPPSADVVDGWRGRLVVTLNEEWERGGSTYPRGSVILVDPGAVGGRTVGVAGPDLRGVEAVFEPGEGEVLVEFGVTAVPQGLLLEVLDDVRGRLYLYEPAGAGASAGTRAAGDRASGGRDPAGRSDASSGWTRTRIPFPDNGQIAVTTAHDDTGAFLARYESFTTPPTLYHVSAEMLESAGTPGSAETSASDQTPRSAETPGSAGALEPEIVTAQEPTFDASRVEVSQQWVTSADGTRVPYFLVARRDLERDGTNPTHVFSYGGFRNALVPSYSGSYEDLKGAYGPAWLERGGVFVLANIRGGGEFGPAWHEAALRENRTRAYEDFEAVAEDLIEAGVTSPGRLGIEGRSNGGLLVLATMARRPDLYGAVIAGSTLSDMRRYHELLAGASWMAEYGDPDVAEDWSFIREYSPYHNLEPGVDYPPVFFYTSTRDDRVHPGHARKTAALLEALGSDVRYWENIEGGHGGSVTHEQLARRVALGYVHLWREIGGR